MQNSCKKQCKSGYIKEEIAFQRYTSNVNGGLQAFQGQSQPYPPQPQKFPMQDNKTTEMGGTQ